MRGSLVVPGPVFAELVAAPARSEVLLDSFCKETVIAVDWNLNEATWRAAGRAFQQNVVGRRQQRDSGARRTLADFLSGAHALHHGFRLLTLDDRLYRAAFPRLAILSV